MYKYVLQVQKKTTRIASRASCCMYMLRLGSILRHHGIDYHIYSDDIQLYTTFDLSDPTIEMDKINLCISDLRIYICGQLKRCGVLCS